MANSEAKYKYWGFFGYPDSLPADYEEILNLTGLPWAKSPLHDKDIDPDGNYKKPHYHFIIVWTAATTFSAVRRFVCDTLHQPIPKPLIHPRGYYRYFTHADNPEKAQYDSKGIEEHQGFDISAYFSSEEVEEVMLDIGKIIRDLNFIEYSDLYYYLLDTQPRSYVTILQSHTIHFNALLRSLRFKGAATTTSPLGD